MPYYRRRGYAKYGRRYSGKRKAKGWWKSKVSRKGKGDSGLRFFKLRSGFEVSVDSNGGFSMYSSLQDPTKVVNGTNTIGDWSSCSSLFDNYRVHAHKLKWVPSYVDNQVGATNFLQYRPMYVYTDYDNAAVGMPVSTVQGVLEYENANTKNFNMPWKRYVRVPKMVKGTDARGYHDIGAPLDQGVHCVYAPNVAVGLTSGTVVGTFIITYYVSFKNRR